MSRPTFYAALACAVLLTPALAEAKPRVYQLKGEGAYGSLYRSDDCSNTLIDVFVTEDVAKLSFRGAPVRTSAGRVAIQRIDWCTGTQFYGTADLPNLFKGDGRRLEKTQASFRVNAEQYRFDETSQSWKIEKVPVQIELRWKGTGARAWGFHRANRPFGSFARYIQNNVGIERAADAAALLQVSGQPLLFADGEGTMSYVQQGSVQILQLQN